MFFFWFGNEVDSPSTQNILFSVKNGLSRLNSFDNSVEKNIPFLNIVLGISELSPYVLLLLLVESNMRVLFGKDVDFNYNETRLKN